MYLLEATNALAHFLCLFLCFLTIAADQDFRKNWVLRNKIKILLCIAFALLMDLVFLMSRSIWETLLHVLPLFLFSGIILSKKLWMRIRSKNIIMCITALVLFAIAYYNFFELIQSIKKLFVTYV